MVRSIKRRLLMNFGQISTLQTRHILILQRSFNSAFSESRVLTMSPKPYRNFLRRREQTFILLLESVGIRTRILTAPWHPVGLAVFAALLRNESPGSTSAQPLLRPHRHCSRCSPSAYLLSRCCSGASVSLHLYSVPLLSPCYYWRTIPCPHLPSLRIFCQFYAKVWRPSFGTSGGMAH
jgi:hypothetical protein